MKAINIWDLDPERAKHRTYKIEGFDANEKHFFCGHASSDKKVSDALDEICATYSEHFERKFGLKTERILKGYWWLCFFTDNGCYFNIKIDEF